VPLPFKYPAVSDSANLGLTRLNPCFFTLWAPARAFGPNNKGSNFPAVLCRQFLMELIVLRYQFVLFSSRFELPNGKHDIVDLELFTPVNSMPIYNIPRTKHFYFYFYPLLQPSLESV
jgi:hypothetical protein